jgi:hypothetical protein
MNACKTLNSRIGPIRDGMPGASWSDVIEKCYGLGVDLSAHGWYSPDLYVINVTVFPVLYLLLMLTKGGTKNGGTASLLQHLWFDLHRSGNGRFNWRESNHQAGCRS